MHEPKKNEIPSWIIRSISIFWRRKVWFFVPFFGSAVLSLGIILALTQFYDSTLFPSNVKVWLEEESALSTRRSLERIKETLHRQEGEIRQFKEMNKNDLADRMRSHLRILGQLHVDLFETKRAVQSQNRGEERLGSANPLVLGLAKKKRALETLRKQFPKNHPKVIAIERELKIFEMQVSDISNRPETPASEESLASLLEREKQLTEKVRMYERSIENAPILEKALAVLLGNYEVTRQSYQDLLNRNMSYIPNTVRIALYGIIGGLLIGLVLVVIREKTDRSLRTREELEQILPVPVFAVISDYKTVPLEGRVKPSTMRAADVGGGSSMYGHKTLFLIKDRP